MSSSALDLAFDAIENADVVRLRKTLHHLCARSNTTLDLVCKELLLATSLDKKKQVEHKENASSVSNDEDTAKGVKRKLEYTDLRYRTCKQCSQEYDVTNNTDQSCAWHEGKPNG